MDIHKPKPWHNVREFLKEYVIIVVGVLTALGAEQTVEWLHWRHEVHVAREAVAFDLKRLVGAAAAEDAQSACTARRLADLGALIDKAADAHRLAPMGWTGMPQRSSWGLRSWSALVAGQTLAHFPNREQIILAGLARFTDRISSIQLQEVDDWSTLHVLSGPGRTIADPEIAASRIALTHAYMHAGQQKSLSRAVMTMVVGSGLLTRSEIDAAYRDGVASVASNYLCRPPPAPAANAAEDLGQYLREGALRPGENRVVSPGVGDAIATEK